MQPDEFWQEFTPRDHAPKPPYTDRFPAQLPAGQCLLLPIRPLGDTGTAIASLILNQAAFEVEHTLADQLAAQLDALRPTVVVGLPTLGLSLARLVAGRLGHKRFVALGTSRKFWYDDALSVPMSSITSPDTNLGAQKRLFLDPRMVPLLAGKRVVLVDDVISSGSSICAGLAVLHLAGVTPVGIGVAMIQTQRWRAKVEQAAPGLESQVSGAFSTPLLHACPGGWRPAP